MELQEQSGIRLATGERFALSRAIHEIQRRSGVGHETWRRGAGGRIRLLVLQSAPAW